LGRYLSLIKVFKLGRCDDYGASAGVVEVSRLTENVRMVRITAIFAFLLLCIMPSIASAQTVNQYTNTTTGNIVDSTNCATIVTRTFNVGSSYIVSDVDIGVFLSHTYRSDLQISLTSPPSSNITVNIMTNTAG
jgi:hypothetical protein